MAARLTAVQPVLASRDVAASIRFYERLGFRSIFQDAPDDPKYAAVVRDDIELHLQWNDPKDWDAGTDRPTYRFVVDDVDGLFDEWRAAGALPDDAAVRDTPWGTREFHVRDPDVNGLQFYRASE